MDTETEAPKYKPRAPLARFEIPTYVDEEGDPNQLVIELRDVPDRASAPHGCFYLRLQEELGEDGAWHPVEEFIDIPLACIATLLDVFRTIAGIVTTANAIRRSVALSNHAAYIRKALDNWPARPPVVTAEGK